MSEKNKNPFVKAGGYFSVPRAVARKLAGASGDEVKVAVFFCANPEASTADAAAFLKLSLSDVDAALAFWRGADGTDAATEPKVSSRPMTPPDYSGAQLAEICARNKNLASILTECQKLLGKTFTSHDTEIYVGSLYDWLGLSPEYILALTSYCCDTGKKNVRYIEKTAISLVGEGVDDYAKLEIYISESEKRAKTEYKLRKLFGFGERALTASEKKHFASFEKYSFELVESAYEQMIKSIGSVRLGYLAKILESWKEQGIDTPEKAEAKKGGGAKKIPSDKFTSETFDFDEFLSAAIKNGAEKKGRKK